MPPCKNDAARSYKGDEPSPKGFGYCAHAEPQGSRRKGRDGAQWSVATDANGRRFWKRGAGPRPQARRSAASVGS